MSYRLSERMKGVCCLAKPEDGSGRRKIAEIGCDHAYISMELLKRDYYDYVLAMDVREGPLQRAEQNKKQEFLDQPELNRRLEIRKSDGLSAVASGELDAVIFAGMGGGLMVRLFEESMTQFLSIPVLILQPQSELVSVRQFLMEHNYGIVKEDMVAEDGKYYPMLRAKKMEKAPRMDLCELTFGPELIRSKNAVLCHYLEQKIKKNHELIRMLEKETKDRPKQRAWELKEELAILNLALKRMDANVMS